MKIQPFVETVKDMRNNLRSLTETHSSDNQSNRSTDFESSDWQRLKMTSSDEDILLVGEIDYEKNHLGDFLLFLGTDEKLVLKKKQIFQVDTDGLCMAMNFIR